MSTFKQTIGEIIALRAGRKGKDSIVKKPAKILHIVKKEKKDDIAPKSD